MNHQTVELLATVARRRASGSVSLLVSAVVIAVLYGRTCTTPHPGTGRFHTRKGLACEGQQQEHRCHDSVVTGRHNVQGASLIP